MNTKISFFSVLAFSLIFSACGFVLPKGKITILTTDESGNPIPDAEINIHWRVPKTNNPWDGQTTISHMGNSDKDGLFSSTENALSKVYFTIDKTKYYQSKLEYTFGNEVPKDSQWQPWNPTISMRLREIENPIPMYAKRYGEMETFASDFSYDLIKGDFLPPHGQGETADCTIAFSNEKQGDGKTLGDRSQRRFEFVFLGDFNGFTPIPTNAIISESQFIWPRTAYSQGYDQQTLAWQHTSEYVMKPAQHLDPPVPYTKQTEIRTPESRYLFFRIRAEKNPDGTFKSALYGKMIAPESLHVYTFSQNDKRNPGKTRYTLKNFTFYVNPTHNDLNMEYAPNQNLMYKDDYIDVGDGVRVVNPQAFKDGGGTVTTP